MGAEDVRQRLLGKFREVLAERVEKISSGLLALERGPADGARQELARELHTLKGEAGMMGFAGLSRAAHAAEDLLKAVVPGASGPALDALLAACDAFPGLLDGPAEAGDALAERLRAAAAPAAGPGAPPSPPAPLPAGRGEQAPAASAEQTPGAASSPAPSPAARERAGVRAERPAARAADQGQAVRVDVDRLDEIAALVSDVVVEGTHGADRARDVAALFARWARVSDRLLAATGPLRRGGEDRLADQLEGEVHALRGDTFRFLRRHLDAQAQAQGQVTQLAQRVSDARLIPLFGVLAGLPRAARDQASSQGKRIECDVTGGETSVDRAILFSLHDPLLHLLRNAVDHGLETPAEREAVGKPPVGRITVSARPDGDLLTVVVEDDGRGIDPERVRAAALRKGFLEEQQAAALPARAVVDLIFQPGFSTLDEVGETSGRGVGLDVVRQRIVALGGSVHVDSEVGRGTRFTIRIPQSLSLVKVLLVRVGEDVFGLAAMDVEAVGRIDPGEVAEVAGVPAVKHRDRLVPVVALGSLLSLGEPPRAARPACAYLWQGSQGVAVTVDRLLGQREVAVKTPGAFAQGVRFVSGAAFLEDGRVALLLSTAELLEAARGGSGDRRRERAHRLRVLLVDDSAIARDAEAAMVTALGHQVELASDGEEAWRKLQAGEHDVLLTDVQMPVLDGIALTRRVRAAPRLARLPVVILSSLSSPEDRRRGVEAGADAYLVKGELDAPALAAALARLCGAPA